MTHACPFCEVSLTSQNFINLSKQVPIFRKRKTFQAECEETPFAKECKTANSGKLPEIAVPSTFLNNDVSCSNVKPRSGGTIEFPQEQPMNINSVLSITSASKKKNSISTQTDISYSMNNINLKVIKPPVAQEIVDLNKYSRNVYSIINNFAAELYGKEALPRVFVKEIINNVKELSSSLLTEMQRELHFNS
ncbi:hypothetical protein PV328_007660 [Microctonus aethiopoides]|uniref:Uncharacterized protein n=1 Tax=Microctonus aethiopoides TaxID=144406 RepID=A0AA39EYX1_9HYME|nr:hypothetical protein PV328_007660 [Microctonus aethiopoides]